MSPKLIVSHDVVTSIDQVTVEFLRASLANPAIASFRAEQIGTGQVGEVHRLWLDFAGAATPDDHDDDSGARREDSDAPHNSRRPLPTTIIFKCPSRSPRSRASAVSMGIYEAEARFYAELAPRLPPGGPVAACYYAGYDPNSALGSLLLEDAAAAAVGAAVVVVGDELRGATREQASQAMRALGLLHGALKPMFPLPSGDEDGDGETAAAAEAEAGAGTGWLVREPAANQAFFHEIFLGFRARYGARVAPEHMAACERYVGAFDWWLAQQEKTPAALLGVRHGDYRLDNMLFLTSPSSPSPSQSPSPRLRVVDWQCVAAGPLVGDVAYFLGCSVRAEDRRAWQDELLAAYCAGLAEGLLPGDDLLGPSPPAPGPEAVRRELRLQSLGSIAMSLMSSMLVDPTPRGDDMFMAAIARECELAADLDALSLLPPPPLPAAVDSVPLQPLARDELPHPAGPGKFWNESWYFDFVDEAQGVAGWVRVGLTPRMRGNWYTAVVSRRCGGGGGGGAGGGVYVLADLAAPPVAILPSSGSGSEQHRGGRLELSRAGAYDVVHEVRAGEELQSYRIRLSSTAARFYADPNDVLVGGPGSEPLADRSLSLDLTYATAGVPYRYRISTRYEIPCAVSGRVSVGGGGSGDGAFELSAAYGQRDHSWAARDWWAMDWLWASFSLGPRPNEKEGEEGEGRTDEKPAAAAASLRVHATDLRWPGRPSMSMGYVQGAGRIAEISSLRCAEDAGEVGRRGAEGSSQLVRGMRLAIRAEGFGGGFGGSGEEENEEIRVEVEPLGHGPLRLVGEDGRVSMFDRAWGRVRAADGREGVGWFEWNMNVWE